MALFLFVIFTVFLRPGSAAPSVGTTNGKYPHPSNGICRDVTINEEVTWTKAIWGLPKPKDNFDIVALRISEGALDGAAEIHPFSKIETAMNTYSLTGTFCTPSSKKDGKEKTVLLASHGGGYDRRYWASSYKPAEYNFVQHALDSGYSVLYYDRLGTGQSQMVSGYESQASNQIELIAKIAKSVRSGKYTADVKASKVVLVGHSLGSIYSSGAIAKYPDIAEGVVLTGAAIYNDTDPARYTRALALIFQDAKLASTLDPPFPRDSGYVGLGDIYAHATAFFHQPFDVPTLEYAQSILQPASIVEQATAGAVNFTAPLYKGSVLVTTGQWDMLACGGNCAPRIQYGVQDKDWPAAKHLETYLHPGAGHGVNFAHNATGFYATIMSFLDRNI
ncbi:Alpha/Beta hydrolase protein [Clohesyomyces aquaticus]|uniref:Alpha/Beta hydrolase protein n=1 Tax=Clohesyomyces aquaticus TaxID=1231657 RepID=A0A1Y2A8W4_9PLEO|nr:Alpha/Beta hydrolase protein [Clohesyomyces aquaticus]